METPGYTLKNIEQFTDDDPDSLKKIIVSFVDTTTEHIELLKDSLRNKQWDTISRIAHKMLPLFRQLEARDIIPLLEKMEQADKHSLSPAESAELTAEIIGKATELTENIRKNMLPDIKISLNDA